MVRTGFAVGFLEGFGDVAEGDNEGLFVDSAGGAGSLVAVGWSVASNGLAVGDVEGLPVTGLSVGLPVGSGMK